MKRISLIAIFIYIVMNTICGQVNVSIFDHKGELGTSGLRFCVQNGKCGYINTEGVAIVPISYDYEQGDYNVYTSHVFPMNRKYGYIETWNNSTILVRLRKNGKYGFVNHNGEVVIPFKYDMIDGWDFLRYNALLRARIGNSYGLIDVNGREIVPVKYKNTGTCKSGEPTWVQRGDGKIAYVNSDGSFITDFKYTKASEYFFGGDNEVALVAINDLWGFIDKSGKEYFFPKYTYAHYVVSEEGWVSVVKNGKLGFIDLNENIVIPFQYDVVREISQFNYGVANVRKNGKWALIDKDGKAITAFKYDKCDYPPHMWYKIDMPMCEAQIGGKIVYLDILGNEYSTKEELNDSAFSVLTKAANSGISVAAYCLSKNYEEGNGVAKDSVRAFEWCKKAVELGYASAEYELAKKYYYGQGCVENYDNAYRWMKSAADRGETAAYLFLGWMLYHGHGTEKNLENAFSCFYKSSCSGNERQSQYYLGWLYEHGQGVPTNIEEAKKWYAQSSFQGYKPAKERLSIVLGKKDNKIDFPKLLKDYFLNAQIDLSLPGYDYHDTYYSGYNLIRVCKNGKWGLVNRDAEVIAPCKYDNLSEKFEEGLMWAVLNGKVGYINEKGETIIPFEYINNYSNISDDKDFYCGLACVCINPDERVLINHKGERVTPSSKHYREIGIYQHHANGIWIAFTKHKTVFLDIYGKEYKYGKYSTSQSTYSSQQAICDKIKSMALNGDPVAQYNLGIMYTRGASMFNYNVNKGNATTFLRKSAKQGFKPAQLYLSKLLYSVKDTTFNEEAYLWYKEYSGMKINPSDISPASIIWLVYEPTTRQKDYSFKIGVKSDSKIEDVSVYINGVLARGIIPVHNDGFNMTIDRTVALNDGQNTIKVMVKNAGGTATTEKTVTYQNQGIATIDWLAFSPTTTEKQFALKAGIKSTSKIESWTVSVNGVVDRGINPVKNDGYTLTIDKMLTLSEGSNTVMIEVRNAGGIAMAEKSVIYSPKKATPIVQQKRIALVMGNANYRDMDKRLKNPVNDATDVAAKLESLGFTVIRSLDQTQQGMEAAINNFGSQARNYDVALFYYAGHGVRCNGSNYLIPVDANLPEESYVQYKCTNANLVLDLMNRAHCQMKIVILDACRNNPFARSWTRSTDGGGLNIMNAPKGTFIAFSTAPGDVAQDGTERNSPYTAALLQTLDVPNLSITDFFQEVLERVALKTNDRQTPWTSNSFRGNFIFNQK